MLLYKAGDKVKSYHYSTNDAEETMQIAEELATCVTPGSVITLEGDLGAGKTTFTKGFAKCCELNEQFPVRLLQLLRNILGICHYIIWMLIGWNIQKRILVLKSILRQKVYRSSNGLPLFLIFCLKKGWKLLSKNFQKQSVFYRLLLKEQARRISLNN